MNCTNISIVFLFLTLLSWPAEAREWSDASGRFKIDAEFFAASEDTVVIKKRNGSLVGLKIDQLASADKQFVDEKKKALAAAEANPSAGPEAFQTWTSRAGFELRGRVVAFGRRDVVLQRVVGMVNVNGTVFSRLNTFYQHIIPKIVAQFGDPSVKTEKDVEEWLKTKGKEPQTFTVEGVLMKLEDGSELAVPFFLFSEKDLAILNPGWEQWKSAQASEADRKREDFLMSTQANSYQQQRDTDPTSHQIQMMQLELLAVNAGLVSIWEVMLESGQGVYYRNTSVVVPAQNSLQAEQIALQRYPGYVLAGVRKVSY